MSQRKKVIRNRFRQTVFERDNYSCRGCRFQSSPECACDELDAHHITDRNEMPNGGYVCENGVSLCAECHLKAESFHRGETTPPGFSPAELYSMINSSEEAARTASEKL